MDFILISSSFPEYTTVLIPAPITALKRIRAKPIIPADMAFRAMIIPKLINCVNTVYERYTSA